MTLKRGDVFVMFWAPDDGDRFLVLYVNECRALVQPQTPVEVTIGTRTFQKFPPAISISPCSTVRVVGHQRVAKDSIQLPKPMKKAA